jgi:hypothetical protein
MQKAGNRGRKSISVISPASVPKRKHLDEDLPQFDPKSFKPGYMPRIVKKGPHEYVVIVQGVKDTGLCGKYWSDTENLPPRRRYNPGVSAKPSKSCNVSEGEQPQAAGKGRPSKTSRKQTLTPQKMMQDPEDEGQDEEENYEQAKGRRGKRKLTDPNNEDKDTQTAEKSQEAIENGVSPTDKQINNEPDNVVQMVEQHASPLSGVVEDTTEIKSVSSGGTETLSTQGENKESLNKTPATIITSEQTDQTKNGGGTSQASRSVSCVADTNTQREVVVECFAPYDDHRWTNIGKNKTDAVQYAKVLRPPYHLVSSLRMKGHSTKGVSCTDKNTMLNRSNIVVNTIRV